MEADDPNVGLLQRQVRNGANWFYWIAVGILISSSLSIAGWGYGVPVALIANPFFLSIAHELGFNPILLAVPLVVAGVFAVLGFLANERDTWSFIFGMILYALDGVLLILLTIAPLFNAPVNPADTPAALDGILLLELEMVITGLLIHGLALYQLYKGLVATRTLNARIGRGFYWWAA